MRNLSFISSCFLASTTIACFPYWGRVQLPIPADPIKFVDSESGKEIDRVLILPRYGEFVGASTGAGHGPGGGSNHCYIADAFVYEQGTTFVPRQPKSAGVVWGIGWAYTGKGITLDGVVVAAPGYRAQWFSHLWSREGRGDVKLSPTDPGRPEALLALLQKQVLRGSEAELFGYCGGEVQNRLRPEEIHAIVEFLRS